MKQGFFEGTKGEKSSTRLIGFIVIVCSLIFVQEVLYFGRENIAMAATGAVTLFVGLSGPVMYFLFQNKKEELKQN